MKIFVLSLIFLTSGCSNYISKLHSEFDRSDSKYSSTPGNKDLFNQYRSTPAMPGQKGYLSSKDRKLLPPSVKREYRPQNGPNKRYTASDLNDSANASSLWAGEGKDNFLFSRKEKKRSGDIVLIDVFKKLKSEISLELAKAFPSRAMAKKKDDKSKAAPKAAAAPATPEKEDETDKAYDKISGIVIEEISKDHLLIKGRKNLLYKNKKRMIEVQALVARRDITEEDIINSDNILESSINVLR